MIEVIEISFKEMETLILLPNQFKNMLQASQDYGFSLLGGWKCRRKKIKIEDFPKNEWCC
ncbi:hypothetical protein [Polaribacter ponticola]|uniref:Uncharacterized protein n=1 Tax=Polaribacter ponticola TaxID=2978475 RepID=A0ABT5S4C4_9FLAO|nr:hypothetical protein [Polaribacter sp. MSW5]MDD7912954.1 hypothetical protein [Polaribacter sp. MSW5]MDD7912955.1 hypothetical protein [Polaribacter sp. MSW5]MDD7913747.1 hypothetical protein [Polaribacter sp. MSW5]MDD7913748.1 hypothetical protein [Polaribacter sp. MSW5]